MMTRHHVYSGAVAGRSTLEQTERVLEEARAYFLENEKEAVESVMTIAGVSLAGGGQNMGLGFVRMRDWDLRERSDLKVKAVANRAMARFFENAQCQSLCFCAPAVTELGHSLDLTFNYRPRRIGSCGPDECPNQLLTRAAEDHRLTRVRPNGMNEVPQYRIDVDLERAGALGVPINSILPPSRRLSEEPCQ
jgi:HAE1 family hydrophobic/amphiphilic exporter-1